LLWDLKLGDRWEERLPVRLWRHAYIGGDGVCPSTSQRYDVEQGALEISKAQRAPPTVAEEEEEGDGRQYDW
jgi:hypothetical protein